MDATINAKLKVSATIEKYAEGVTPETGEPYEVVTLTLEGDEAEQYLKQAGISKEDLINGNA